MIKKNVFLIIAALLVFSACAKEEKPQISADLLITNCNLATLSDTLITGNTIAVRGDTIWKIGFIEQLIKHKSDSTIVIDAKKNFVMPGLIDSHMHLLSLGASRVNLDLSGAKNWDEVILMVVNAAREAGIGKWVVGRGWHQDKWNPKPVDNVNGYPVHDVLSEAVPANPVILTHASGHAAFANKKAMDLAGIDDSTANPEGGVIVRNADGKATGVFEETAEELIWKPYLDKQAKLSTKQKNDNIRRNLTLALDELKKYGITSIHDAGSTFEEVEIYKKEAEEGSLTTRLNIMLYETNKILKEKIGTIKDSSYNTEFLRVRSVKKYIDGALGSRGALLFEPYNDLPEHTGLQVTPNTELRETAKLCLKHGFQICTHAIGTKGNSEMLDIYSSVLKKSTAPDSLRWRIEHAQHVLPQDIKRFAKYGIIAAMQGKHCTSDAVFVAERLGEERARETSYAWRSMIDGGVIVCNGTDAPVESVNPFESIYSSITRKTESGFEFFPEQKMTREEALKSYTINGAYASFEEDIKGTLELGKLADIIIIDTDLINAPEDDIKNAKVLFTIVGGKIVYGEVE
ncbi:MAG: amidohydrolase [Melioribacteraceae bacterium]|nr:MAG: amidohydrolase [Melioribacteraceae bacterium]